MPGVSAPLSNHLSRSLVQCCWEECAFRDEVRAFFEENVDPAVRAKLVATRHIGKDELVNWQRVLNKKGWAVPHWPAEYGGTGWSAVKQYIFLEECVLCRRRHAIRSAQRSSEKSSIGSSPRSRSISDAIKRRPFAADFSRSHRGKISGYGARSDLCAAHDVRSAAAGVQGRVASLQHFGLVSMARAAFNRPQMSAAPIRRPGSRRRNGPA